MTDHERIHIIRYSKQPHGYNIESGSDCIGHVTRCGSGKWLAKSYNYDSEGRTRKEAVTALLRKVRPKWKELHHE